MSPTRNTTTSAALKLIEDPTWSHWSGNDRKADAPPSTISSSASKSRTSYFGLSH
jgi:hypothetical protein